MLVKGSQANYVIITHVLRTMFARTILNKYMYMEYHRTLKLTEPATKYSGHTHVRLSAGDFLMV